MSGKASWVSSRTSGTSDVSAFVKSERNMVSRWYGLLMMSPNITFTWNSYSRRNEIMNLDFQKIWIKPSRRWEGRWTRNACSINTYFGKHLDEDEAYHWVIRFANHFHIFWAKYNDLATHGGEYERLSSELFTALVDEAIAVKHGSNDCPNVAEWSWSAHTR